MKSGNPRRVQLECCTVHIYTLWLCLQALLIPACPGSCPCLRTHDTSSLLTQVRRTCLLFAYATPVNGVLSYHIWLHVSQFTNKLARDKMKSCLAMEGFVFQPSLFLGNAVLVRIPVCFLGEGD